MSAREPVVEVEGLTVRYGRSWGVQDVGFTIGEGSVCGLIGPNGAGKSTTMKVISGLLTPQGGSARVLGWDVRRSSGWVRWHVGFMPDVLNLPDALNAADYLRFAAAVHALPPQGTDAAIEEVLALVDLSEHRYKEIGQLSKGMRQRLHLARTLLPQPKLLVLDEPASGLDPRARIEFRALVRELQRMGCTILISSHVLADLSEVCDSLVIIEEGRTVVAGTLDEIRSRLSPRLKACVETTSDPERLGAWLGTREGVHDVKVEASKVRFSWDGDKQGLSELIAAVATDGHRFCSVTLEHADVEDVFLSFTRGIVS
jgi:ABC-2 type transport system ATP-binding protein